MRLVGSTLALQDHHPLHGPAVGGTSDRALAGQLLERHAGHYVGELAEAVFFERLRTVGLPAGGLYDRADGRRFDAAVALDAHLEPARLTGDVLELGPGKDPDVGARFDLAHELVEVHAFEVTIGRPLG